MVKIYLVRHGESVANTEGRYQGQTYDTSLSLLGEKQIDALKKRFAGQEFDDVFVSPLKRTMRTASVLRAKEQTVTLELLETNHGQWEGKNHKEIASRWPALYAFWRTQPSKAIFPEGEAFTETISRAVKWLDSLEGKSGVFAVVTHSNIICALLSYIQGISIDKMWQWKVQPTSVTLIVGQNTREGWEWKVDYEINTDHLDKLQSDLTTHAI